MIGVRVVKTRRVVASSCYDLRTRPSCYLCRTRQDTLVVGEHVLPPAKKQGQAGGLKRLRLCFPCALAMAREAVK